MGQLADPGRYVPDIEEETTNGTLKIPYVNGHKPLQNPLNTPFNTDLKIPTYHLAFLFNSLSSGWEQVFNWATEPQRNCPTKAMGSVIVGTSRTEPRTVHQEHPFRRGRGN